MKSICEAAQTSAQGGVDCEVRMEHQGSKNCVLKRSNTPRSELRVAGRNRRPTAATLEFTATHGPQVQFLDANGVARITAASTPGWSGKVEMAGGGYVWLPAKSECEPAVRQVGIAAHVDVAVTEVELAFGKEVRTDWASPLAIDVFIR